MAVLGQVDAAGEGEITWTEVAVLRVVYAVLVRGPNVTVFGSDIRYKVERAAWFALGKTIVTTGFPNLVAWTEPAWVQFMQGFYIPREVGTPFSRLRYYTFPGTTVRFRVES